MNVRRVVGISLIVVGVIVVIFSVDAMHRISEAKSGVRQATRPLSGNPIGKVLTQSIESQTSQYDSEIMLCLIGGIALVVLGGGVCLYRHKK